MSFEIPNNIHPLQHFWIQKQSFESIHINLLYKSRYSHFLSFYFLLMFSWHRYKFLLFIKNLLYKLSQIPVRFHALSISQRISKVKTIIHFIFYYFITRTGAKQNWLLATYICYDYAESAVWQEYWFWEVAKNCIQFLMYFFVFNIYEFVKSRNQKPNFW